MAPFIALCCAFRITLKRMPSIRESMWEMGVSVEQVLTEMAQKSTEDTLDKAIPTPLTNYLDVGHVLFPLGVKVLRGWRKVSFHLDVLVFVLDRLSILGKSASALQLRCSMWCLTRAQQTCGCPRKDALPSQPPVVSVLSARKGFQVQSGSYV